MKNNEINKDRGLRLVLQHRNEAAEKMTLPEDFTDRLMQRIEPKKVQPKRRRVWLYTAIGAVAACILLLLTLYYKHDHVETGKGTVIAQQTEQHEQSNKADSPSLDENSPSQPTEQLDTPVKTKEGELQPMIAPEKISEEKAHTTSTGIPTTDSLDYYIDKIERELTQVDESLYIERMNKIIRADERLQRIVNSYILHTLDEEGRPQTADNMYNLKTEQDEK